MAELRANAYRLVAQANACAAIAFDADRDYLRHFAAQIEDAVIENLGAQQKEAAE